MSDVYKRQDINEEDRRELYGSDLNEEEAAQQGIERAIDFLARC